MKRTNTDCVGEVHEGTCAAGATLMYAPALDNLNLKHSLPKGASSIEKQIADMDDRIEKGAVKFTAWEQLNKELKDIINNGRLESKRVNNN